MDTTGMSTVLGVVRLGNAQQNKQKIASKKSGFFAFVFVRV
jgi:hypothetical protein